MVQATMTQQNDETMQFANSVIYLDMLTSNNNLKYLSFYDCSFYDMFHHIYNMTNLVYLNITKCKIFNSLNQTSKITDDIVNLTNLTSLYIDSIVEISSKIFTMKLKDLSISNLILLPPDCIYSNLENYDAFNIGFLHPMYNGI